MISGFLRIVFWASLLHGAAWAGVHPERWYQERWCATANGTAEVVLTDGTRCDCLTDEYAIEFDFGRKWAEAIGQSLHYGHLTGRQPGVVLIIESDRDAVGEERLRGTVDAYQLPITIWTTRP